eukprot:TRINITY_DN55505_c0_g1_i1.p1 TRINITY_DN55505_c0_g1~~TRINITY_DN55505_c0_g1_i1.p1  ORF type:complete len:119 (-),score=25.19 TRINITY_DN55505_c0_g1_i1:132-488(-)
MLLKFLVLLLALVAFAKCQQLATSDFEFEPVDAADYDKEFEDYFDFDRTTATVIFSIDRPLFRTPEVTNYSDLNGYADDDDKLPPIGWPGPTPNFETSGAATYTVCFTLIIVVLSLLF